MPSSIGVAMKANVNGAEIDYRDDGEGAPIVFAHAFPLNQSMWNEQVSVLSTGYRIVSLDQRGLGESELSVGGYSMDDVADDVRSLIQTLGIDQAVVVGLSMGGYVSMAFYRKYPQMVRALVLADTRAANDTEEGRQRRLASAEKAEREGSSAIAYDMVPLLLGRTTLESKPDLVNRVRRMIEANSRAGIAAAQRAMAARPDSTALLSEATVPVLIVVGSEDSLTPPSEAEVLQKSIPSARLTVIDGAGHLSNMEQPAAFNRTLSEFLKSL